MQAFAAISHIGVARASATRYFRPMKKKLLLFIFIFTAFVTGNAQSVEKQIDALINKAISRISFGQNKITIIEGLSTRRGDKII